MSIIYEIKEINTITGDTRSRTFDSLKDCLDTLKSFLLADSLGDVTFYRYEVETRMRRL